MKSFIVIKLSTAIFLSGVIAVGGYFGGNALVGWLFSEENSHE